MPIMSRTISRFTVAALLLSLNLPAPQVWATEIIDTPIIATSEVAVDAVDDKLLPQAVQVVEPALLPVVVEPAAIQPLPSPVVANDDVLISAFRFTHLKGYDYIELFNTSDEIVDVRDMSIKLLYSDTVSDFECNIVLRGYILPQKYVTFAQATSNVMPLDGVYAMDGCDSPTSDAYDKEIQVYRGAQLIESVRITASDFTPSTTLTSKAWVRSGFTATYREGTMTSDFKAYNRSVANTPDIVYTSYLYEPPNVSAGMITEIMPNPKLCTIVDVDVACSKYVKIVNTTDAPIDLTNYRLRSGGRDEKSSVYNTSYLSGVVMPNSYLVVSKDANGAPLALDADEATTWFEDVFGVAVYDSGAAIYVDGDTVAHQGKSWAHVTDDEGGTLWQWTTAAPLTLENVYYVAPVIDEPGKGALDIKPCRDGQYRSEETGRCRSIALAGDTLTACKEGQYRSEETNRCRSIATTVAAELKPCGDDQFRNPLTGRCKKIASTDDIIQPCDAGYERNVATNRCRKIQVTDMPLAAFPVETIKQSATSAVSWWALGGVLFLAASRGVWEWRHELLALSRRIVGRGTSSGE